MGRLALFSLAACALAGVVIAQAQPQGAAAVSGAPGSSSSATAVADTASWYAGLRPPLDEVSRRAIEQQADDGRPGTSADDEVGPAVAPAEDVRRMDGAQDAPEAILWAALSLAPDDGVTAPELMEATGMSRPWIYQRLRELAERGHVIQVSRGRWRAVIDDAS